MRTPFYSHSSGVPREIGQNRLHKGLFPGRGQINNGSQGRAITVPDGLFGTIEQ